MKGRKRRVRARAWQIAGLGEKDRATLEKAAEILKGVIAAI
jgi:hypothetical protein